MTPRASNPAKNKNSKGLYLCESGDTMTEVMLSRLTEVPAVYDGTNNQWKEITRSTHVHVHCYQSHQPFLQTI